MNTNKIKQIIVEEINISSETNADKIINFIESLPNKYKLKTKWGDYSKPYENGVDTALNNGMITHFYLKYYNNKKKKKSILPTPSLSVELYEKLNNLIMLGDEYDNLLFKMNCFQLMNLLLYVDYFNVDFRFADVRKIIQNIIPPKNKKEFDDLFNLFNNKDGKIRTVLFYADSTPIVRTIEIL